MAAIRALDNIDTTSRMVYQAKESLNLISNHEVVINWIKAHVNHKGNEIADNLAKTGCKLPCAEGTPLSQAFVKEAIKKELYKEWDRRWQTQGDCRQTFSFFPCVDRGKSKKISEMSRYDLGIMVRYLTGHAHLRRHNKIAKTPQPIFYEYPEMKYSLKDPDDNHEGDHDRQITCRLCKLAGKEETPFHLATECLAAWKTRMHYLGCYSLESEEVPEWKPDDLLKFFKHFDLENKPNTL